MERGQGLLPSPLDLTIHDHSFLRALELDDNLPGDWVGHCTQDSSLYDLRLSLVFQKGKPNMNDLPIVLTPIAIRGRERRWHGWGGNICLVWSL